MPRRPDDYTARGAWLRGIAYFVACTLVGWWTGALDLVVGRGLAPPDPDLGYWLWTTAAFAVVALGYGVVWREGTLTHGRTLDPSGAVGFGIAWGLTESLLLLSFWVLVRDLGWSPPWTAVGAYVVISAWQGGWHALYWDHHVAPEHNIASWNLAKVAFAHTPNLAVSLTHLALYERPAVFVLLQTLALTLSTWNMRFPGPTSPVPPAVPVATGRRGGNA